MWRDTLGRVLMSVAALGAVFAGVSGLGAVASAPPSTAWLEAWRAFGFLVFAGLFALLALRPRRSPGVWELVFFHKTALAVTALVLPAARGSADGVVDGVLALFVLTAYLLTRGWQGWRQG